MWVRSRPIKIVVALVLLSLSSACTTTTVVQGERLTPLPTATPIPPTPEADPASVDADRGDRAVPTPTNPADIAADGFGLGGAEQIASLQDSCERGDNRACDVLFMLTDFGSDAELIAVTCGGREPSPQTFCTSGIAGLVDETDTETELDLYVFNPESEGLDTVVTACEDDGDMTACDFLYFRSPADSDLEVIGGTCGGRLEVAVPDCRTVLGEFAP